MRMVALLSMPVVPVLAASNEPVIALQPHPHYPEYSVANRYAKDLFNFGPTKQQRRTDAAVLCRVLPRSGSRSNQLTFYAPLKENS